MKTTVRGLRAAVILFLVAGAAPAAAQPSSTPSVTLAVSGSFARGGSFSGTITVNRFEQRATGIAAVGFVSGTLSRGSRSIGTGFTGEVALPVTINVGGAAAARRDTAPMAQFTMASWIPSGRGAPGFARVQESCPVVDVVISSTTVNVGGAEIVLDPVTLHFTGVAGTPIGDLICAAEGLIGNVAGLVNLLNQILGLLTGLLGGLTGGLGGMPV